MADVPAAPPPFEKRLVPEELYLEVLDRTEQRENLERPEPVAPPRVRESTGVPRRELGGNA